MPILALLVICTTNIHGQEERGTVRVFVLAGQSNMQGHGVVDLDDVDQYNGGKGTLRHLIAQPGNREQFAHLLDGEGWSVRKDVFVRYRTRHEVKTGGLTIGFSGYQGQHHMGPELQFGHVTGDFYDEPVLLIKTAWGGKSLNVDFRPPSAVNARGGVVGPFYGKMLEEVDEAIRNLAVEFPELESRTPVISGFVWQQGWNDMINADARDEYLQNLVNLIADIRDHWKQPDLPVVVGELGNGGNEANDSMRHFRRQQSRIDAHPPYVGNVAFVPTAGHARPAQDSPNTGHGHHWFGNAESYYLVGDSLGRAMVRLDTRPSQPRVLLLGDSISIGYTPFVKAALSDSAFVVRPMRNHQSAENCQGTKNGVRQIERWLTIGGGEWDVIHFNFGLHDLKHVDPETGKNSNDPEHPEQSPPELYETSLREIVARLKTTKAALVFATTTPYPANTKPFRDVAAVEQYNAIARQIMEENGIVINDLCEFAGERLEKIQKPVNVHFTREGSGQLAQQVIEHIQQAIKSNQ